MTTNAQARAKALQLKADQAAAALTEATARAEQYAAHAERAHGYTHRLSNPRALLMVQPDGYGHWAVFLNAPDRAGSWTGEDWGPLNADYTDLYRWTLPEAMAAVDALVAQDAAGHARWLTGRSVVEQQATPIHDAMAHVGPKHAGRMVSA
jgi:hypothetical protein